LPGYLLFLDIYIVILD